MVGWSVSVRVNIYIYPHTHSRRAVHASCHVHGTVSAGGWTVQQGLFTNMPRWFARQDAARDAIAHHATQDAANLGANLFVYGIHDIVDKVELVFFQVLWDLASTPNFFLYTMCVGRVYTCVYICVHIYTPSLPSLHVCVCVCMFTCTHTDLHVCVYIRTLMHADGCAYIFT